MPDQVFPSVQWVEELARKLNDMPAYRDSAANWKGKLVLVALAEPGKLDHDVAIGMDPTGGTIHGVHAVEDHENCEAEYVLSAKYSYWKEIIRGKYDVLYAVMTGKVRLRGNVFKLMLQLKTPEIMLHEMRTMATRFADEW